MNRSSSLLHEIWKATVDGHRTETALFEPGTGRHWTFQALDRASERDFLGGETGAVFPSGAGLAFPRGRSAEFVLSVIKAWREGLVLCPVEEGAAARNVLDLWAANPGPTEARHLKLSSGTTGRPKLILFGEGQMAADADQIVETMGLRPDWPNVGVLSMAHSYGFSNLVLPLLLHGIPLILAPSNLPEALRGVLRSHPAVTVPSVPALWQTWMDCGVLDGCARVKLAISAGAPLSLDLERRAHEEAGFKICNFYGSSECGAIAFDDSAAVREDTRCVGRPAAKARVDIDADSGRIQVRGDAVGLGYWPLPAPDLCDGRFRTADLGEIRGDNVYWLGRAGDRINVAGRKVHPDRIEEVLNRCPGIRRSLVFGVDAADPERGERIVACLELEAGQETDLGAIQSFAASRLADWERPRVWRVVSSFEHDARGKVSRERWRRRFHLNGGGE